MNSLLNQTYKNFEIIVVDDGSTDNSVKIIQKYVKENSNIFFYQHENSENKGLPATVLLGVKKSTGEYIAFCESDDLWMPNHLSEKINLINRYANPVIIANDVELFGPNKEDRREYIESNLRSIPSEKVLVNVNLKEFGSNIVPTFSCVMIKKDVLKYCNFESVVPAWIDFWLYRQIFIKYPLFYIDKSLTKWRIHNSYNSNDKTLEYLKKSYEFLIYNNAILSKNNYVRKKIERDIRVKCIAESDLFDATWYRKKYTEVAVNNINPAYHYAMLGWIKNYDPSEKFSTIWYKNYYPDIKVNPLLHFVLEGKRYQYNYLPSECKKEYACEKNTAFGNILLVSHELSISGAPMLLLSVAKFLKSKNFNVSVFSIKDGELRNKFLDIGVGVTVNPILFWDKTCENLRDKYDFCICNTICTAHFYQNIKDIIPSICWIHENLTDIDTLFFNKFEKEIMINVLKTSTDLYVPTRFTKKYLKNYTSMEVLQLGYPCQDFCSSFQNKKEKGKITFAVVGVIEKRKGQDVFIEAVNKLSKDVKEKSDFIILGKQSPKDSFFFKIKKKCSGIDFRMPIENIEKYHAFLDQIDVLVCPSREDPYPLVVIDAFMHGKVVIVSNHVGQVDLIENGKNGYVFESENSEQLSKIVSSIVNTGISHFIQEASRKTFVENYDSEIWFNNFRLIMEKKCKK
ncbi:MAG: glycosyltransferase [Alphaproteobacteria bacterium]|nr:glycosyltransferase [Alphaproteobacteria bacterium]